MCLFHSNCIRVYRYSVASRSRNLTVPPSPTNEKDYDTGSTVCIDCGTVASDRNVAFDEVDYRVFAEDGGDSGKEHYGNKESLYGDYTTLQTGISQASFTPNAPKKQNWSTRSLKRALSRDDEEFLRNGLNEIRRVVHSFTQGTTLNEKVVQGAHRIFAKAYLKQMDEKAGKATMQKTGKQRQHLARYRQFLVAGIWKASQDDLDTRGRWTLDLINTVLGGRAVSKASVTKALKFAGIW
jgi:hypothetical protein